MAKGDGEPAPWSLFSSFHDGMPHVWVAASPFALDVCAVNPRVVFDGYTLTPSACSSTFHERLFPDHEAAFRWLIGDDS